MQPLTEWGIVFGPCRYSAIYFVVHMFKVKDYNKVSFKHTLYECIVFVYLFDFPYLVFKNIGLVDRIRYS